MTTKTIIPLHNPMQTYCQNAKLFNVMVDNMLDFVETQPMRSTSGRRLAAAETVIRRTQSSVIAIASNYGFDLLGEASINACALMGDPSLPSRGIFSAALNALLCALAAIKDAQAKRLRWNGTLLVIKNQLLKAAARMRDLNDAIGVYNPEGLYVIRSGDNHLVHPHSGQPARTVWYSDSLPESLTSAAVYLRKNHAEAISQALNTKKNCLPSNDNNPAWASAVHMLEPGRFPFVDTNPAVWLYGTDGVNSIDPDAPRYDPEEHWRVLNRWR